MRRALALNACWLMVFSALFGCSKGPTLPTVSASGVVTLDGSPLEGASVSFTPTTDAGKPANGTTDAQGKFQLKTYLGGTAGQVNGAMPGDYVVMVTKYEGASGGAPPQIDYTKQQQALEEAKRTGKPPADMQSLNQAKMVTPAKYGNPKDTDLKATVKSGDNQPFTFELKSS